MHIARVLVSVAAPLMLLTACATRRLDPAAGSDEGVFRCGGTTVVNINNQSDVVYHVVALDGLKERRLGTAIPGRTQLRTQEPVSSLYLAILVDSQPAPAPGN